MTTPYYDLKKIKDKVSYILENYPTTRNSDLKLIANYMQLFHQITTLRDWAINSDTLRVTPETIRRTRQALNNQGLFLPTVHAVLVKRRLLTKDFKAFARNP